MNIIRKILFHKRINTARRISFGFALIILVGALLLMLPISSKERVVTPFLSALFTTTSATCVTGLTLINVGSQTCKARFAYNGNYRIVGRDSAFNTFCTEIRIF